MSWYDQAEQAAEMYDGWMLVEVGDLQPGDLTRHGRILRILGTDSDDGVDVLVHDHRGPFNSRRLTLYGDQEVKVS